MLRAMAVCAILAVALAAPEIAGEDDEDDDEGSSSSSEDQGATTVDLSGEQEDKQMFIVEGGGKRCLGCGTVDQEYSADTNTTVCVTCYQQFANSLDMNSTGPAHTTTVQTTGPPHTGSVGSTGPAQTSEETVACCAGTRCLIKVPLKIHAKSGAHTCRSCNGKCHGACQDEDTKVCHACAAAAAEEQQSEQVMAVVH